MRGRGVFLAGAACAALALGAAPAMADHHEVRIAEVYPGSNDAEDLEYVQLQMTASGQNFFGDTSSSVTLQGPTGTTTLSVPVNTDVINGQRGRRVLIGYEALETPFGPDAEPDFDFLAGDYLDGAGGAACFISGGFGPIDCVSWGSFAGSTASPTGGDAPALTDASALVRRAPACGGGLIDTNNPSNLTTESPDPFNNGVPAATGTPCPQTTITRKPRRKTTKRRARFKFTATQGVDDFKCKLDSRPFRDCTSPFVKRVSRGRHTFKVRADGDPSPASYSWKVKRPN